jgi:hypothetical protein
MVVNRIIVHRVPVDRPVGMDVGDEVRFRMGAVRGIRRVVVVGVMVLIRCGFGCRNERCLKGKCHRRCHHHDGNAPPKPRAGTRSQLHTSKRPHYARSSYTKLGRATYFLLARRSVPRGHKMAMLSPLHHYGNSPEAGCTTMLTSWRDWRLLLTAMLDSKPFVAACIAAALAEDGRFRVGDTRHRADRGRRNQELGQRGASRVVSCNASICGLESQQRVKMSLPAQRSTRQVHFSKPTPRGVRRTRARTAAVDVFDALEVDSRMPQTVRRRPGHA